MSVILAIDTAAPRLQLAVLRADGDGIVDTSIDDLAQGHAEIIFPRLAALLERNNLVYGDLTRIGVTTGPGSFTGLRIGLSAARGLGLALDIPVIGVPSLLAISLGARAGQPLAVLLDARRDEAYFQCFSAPGHGLGEPEILPIATARARIARGVTLVESPFLDIGLLARFVAAASPAEFPPEAAYIRDADAKPQDKARVARQGAA